MFCLSFSLSVCLSVSVVVLSICLAVHLCLCVWGVYVCMCVCGMAVCVCVCGVRVYVCVCVCFCTFVCMRAEAYACVLKIGTYQILTLIALTILRAEIRILN